MFTAIIYTCKPANCSPATWRACSAHAGNTGTELAARCTSKGKPHTRSTTYVVLPSIIHPGETPAPHGADARGSRRSEWRYFKGNVEEKQCGAMCGGGHSNSISDSTRGICWGGIIEMALQANLGKVSICDTEQDLEGKHGTGGYRRIKPDKTAAACLMTLCTSACSASRSCKHLPLYCMLSGCFFFFVFQSRNEICKWTKNGG